MVQTHGFLSVYKIIYPQWAFWCQNDANIHIYTVKLQWLEHLWDHENMFVTGVVRANVCLSYATSEGIIEISSRVSLTWRYFVCSH